MKVGDMLQHAWKLQEQMDRVEEELSALEVTGSAGGGAVTVTLSGRFHARGVSIDESFVGSDREMLEDLIAAAINDAVVKVEAANRERMAGVTSKLELPIDLKPSS